jgi:integrase/recombinase XerC/integrase/recombinase XerD
VHIKGKGNRATACWCWATSSTTEALKDYLKIRKGMEGDPGALFLNRFGGRLSIFAIEKPVRKRIRKPPAFRRRLTPHALRHTMATMLLNNGKDIPRCRTFWPQAAAVTTTESTRKSRRAVSAKCWPPSMPTTAWP